VLLRTTEPREVASPLTRTLRVPLADGAATTVHVVEHARRDVRLRVRRLPGLTPLQAWCAQEGVSEALVGGFFLRDPAVAPGVVGGGRPLGELRAAGEALDHVPFLAPWDGLRACVHADGADVSVARRSALAAAPAGDLLQAGPLLVRDGWPVDIAPEGFSAGAAQFDSDITDGRHPRAALGVDDDRLIAVACDGRADDEAGLTLGELTAVLLGLGARDALNLDGGGSTSLVSGGALRNVPRAAHGIALPGGRGIATALVFEAA
jgi:hypothetical protein